MEPTPNISNGKSTGTKVIKFTNSNLLYYKSDCNHYHHHRININQVSAILKLIDVSFRKESKFTLLKVLRGEERIVSSIYGTDK